MKKTLIALAALAATGASFAQVTINGRLDSALTQYSGDATKLGLYNSGMDSSLINFSGKEDLGGGLTAIFRLEAGLAADNGAGLASNTNNQTSGGAFVPGQTTLLAPATPSLTNATAASLGGAQGLAFNRYAHVGVAGGFGEVRLGRDYTGVFQQVVAAGDPFRTNGVASSTAMTYGIGATASNGVATATNVGNQIGYMTPNMGGFDAKVQAWFGENSSAGAAGSAASGNGDGYSLVLRYMAGPVLVSVGQQMTKGTAALATATLPASAGDYLMKGLTASYNLGVAKVSYTYAREELNLSTTQVATNTSNLLGLVVPMGAINLKASYVRSALDLGSGAANSTNNANLVGLGADYALSKRTFVYAAYSRLSNDSVNTYFAGGNSAATGSAGLFNAVNPSNSTQGLAIGVQHNF